MSMLRINTLRCSVDAMLLGGSVAGIAYQVEQRLPLERSPLLWKILFIPAGFVAAYAGDATLDIVCDGERRARTASSFFCTAER